MKKSQNIVQRKAFNTLHKVVETGEKRKMEEKYLGTGERIIGMRKK